MMLFAAILALVLSIATGLMIEFANGFSDAPSDPGMSMMPMWIGLVISAVLFVCWHFGWHPSW